MDAFAAIPILDRKVAELETKEPSWKNCRACPFSGKCCDGAELIVFPEEKMAIADYLQRHPEVLAYAVSRFRQKATCYFYDRAASQCRIHEVRPLNCRWTPYMTFSNPDGSHTVRLRDDQCNFIPMSVRFPRIDGTTMSFAKGEIPSGFNTTYLSWGSIAELETLRQRSDTLEPLDVLMSALEKVTPASS